jgi:alpha-glucosidase (family GH31 glycosyl hydrolase)
MSRKILFIFFINFLYSIIKSKIQINRCKPNKNQKIITFNENNNYLISKECKINKDETLFECNLKSNKQTIDKKNPFINNNNLNLNYDENKKINKLKVEIRNLKGDVTHLKIFDEEKHRYEIPRNSIEYFELNKDFIKFSKKNLNNLKNLRVGQPFELHYLSDNGENELFSLFKNDFFFMDDFISFNYNLFSNQIFGYGTRFTDFKIKPGVYTTWPRDDMNFFDDGKGAKNSYGHQPFFLHRKNSTSFIGFAFLNSNPQELIIGEKNQITGLTNINQITIGGIIELLIINGNSANEVLRKYHNIIGNPALPNFWALGWHQSRWGYKNTSELQAVIENYNKYKIPLDTIWSDIDYLLNKTNFSYDQENYKDLPQFINQTKKEGINYVPILDIGIPIINEDKYYQLGKKLNVFIKSNYTGDDLVNEVWPGNCVFPDFTNYDKAKTLWTTGLHDINENLNFDGIWLDMNEPSGFQVGEIPYENLDQRKNAYSNLSYEPGLGRDLYKLNNHSLSLNGIVNPEFAPFNTLFNLKPLGVFYENKITYEYFTNIKKRRPFLLSRSSFMGMNRYSNIWLGDDFSNYQNMTSSIPAIFNAQMYGFNLVGSDICGLVTNTTDDLCARWIALGSFYPFSRNHNNNDTISQEPYALGEKTLDSAKKNIRIKYSLLRYYYTQLYINSIEGGVFFQPMAFQFSDVEEFVEDDKILNQQIMLGKNILFNPILSDNIEDVEFAFPNTNWNKFPKGEIFLKKDENEDLKKNNFTRKSLSGKFSDLHLFIKGGSIIPFYNIIDNENILRTRDLENIGLSLIINPDENGYAEGDLIYDDTDSIPFETIKEGKYFREKITFTLKDKVINFDVINSMDHEYNKNDRYISDIIIYGESNTKLSSNLYNDSSKKLRFLFDNIKSNNKLNENIEYLKSKEGNLHLKLKKPLDLNRDRKLEF